jgi:hypothetical protein
MKGRIISLAFGLITALIFLCFQVVIGCSAIDAEAGNIMGASVVDIAILKNGMLEKITIASITIVVISVLVLLMDKYLDKQAMRK